jgi:hypothetical protein
VKTLQGDLTVGNLEDLLMWQQKIFTALKVPKTYLAYEKDTRSRSVVTAQDIQFARSVRRLQAILQAGLRQTCGLELALSGIDPKTPYTLGLPPISVVDELRVWQTEQLKMLVAQMMKQTFWPSDEWIFHTLLGYDSDEVTAVLKGQVKPDKFNGLLGAPKVGLVANNSKMGKESAAMGLETLLRNQDPEQVAALLEGIDSLRDLLDWQVQGIVAG